MLKTSEPIEIRDTRNKAMYRMDDEYLNGYAKLCGLAATAIYNSLCRHCDTTQQSFPSIDLMAEQHAIDRKTVMRAIKKLQEWNIISVLKEKDKTTKRQKNNVYILVDKSKWLPKPSPTEGLGAESLSRPKPSPFHDQSRVPPQVLEGSTVKDTHKKEEKDKENATNVAYPPTTFFLLEEKKLKNALLDDLEANGYAEDYVEELKDFCLYWSEPTPDGRKQRWQLNKTFEIKRRFITWIKKSRQFKK